MQSKVNNNTKDAQKSNDSMNAKKRVAKRKEKLMLQKENGRDRNDEIATIDAVAALLDASHFILPRALPTQVNPQNVQNVININDKDKLVIVFNADLHNPLSIYSEATNIVEDYSLGYDTSYGFNGYPSGNNIAFDLPMYLYGPDVINAQLPTISQPYTSTILTLHLENNYFNSYSTSSNIMCYKGSLSSFTGNIVFENLYAPSAQFDTMTLVLYQDSKIVQSSSISSSFLGHTTTFACAFDGLSPHDSFGIFFHSPSLALTSGFANFWDPSIVVVADVISKVDYPPITDYWEPLISVCNKWSLTAASLLLKWTGSTLNNGGNISIALFPTGTVFPTDFQDLNQFITNRSYNKYSGRLSNGAHCSYIADEIQQYFFKDMSVTSIPHQRLLLSYQLKKKINCRCKLL